MLVPSMLNMADVMTDSGYTEEQVFDLGISRTIIFLVVVPLIGACRVPVEALSHFMAGDDDYSAEGMPEHYSGALSGRWTIKRERLRILPATWHKWVTDVEDIQARCERQAEDATPSPAPVGADVSASDGVPDWKNTVRAEAWEQWVKTLAENGTPTLENVSKHLAHWCESNEVKTDTGKFPRASYLKIHVIDGKHWNPPRNMSREVAKKHLEQKKQEKQAN